MVDGFFKWFFDRRWKRVLFCVMLGVVFLFSLFLVWWFLFGGSEFVGSNVLSAAGSDATFLSELRGVLRGPPGESQISYVYVGGGGGGGLMGADVPYHHYQLLDLFNDDHLQYLLLNGSRPVNGSFSVIGISVFNGTVIINNDTTVSGNVTAAWFLGNFSGNLVGVSIFNSTYNALVVGNASLWLEALNKYNATYDAKADYAFSSNNFVGNGNFTGTAIYSNSTRVGNVTIFPRGTTYLILRDQYNTTTFSLFANVLGFSSLSSQASNGTLALGTAATRWGSLYNVGVDTDNLTANYARIGGVNVNSTVLLLSLRNQTVGLNFTNTGMDYSWLYNQTLNLNLQQYLSTYNLTYDQWAYNQTIGLNATWNFNQTVGLNFTNTGMDYSWLYNQTLSLNLAQYLSTFNGSYWVENSSTRFLVNQTLGLDYAGFYSTFNTTYNNALAYAKNIFNQNLNTTDNVSFNSVNVSSYVNTSFLTVAGRVINDTWSYNQTRYFNLSWNFNQTVGLNFTNTGMDYSWLYNQTLSLNLAQYLSTFNGSYWVENSSTRFLVNQTLGLDYAGFYSTFNTTYNNALAYAKNIFNQNLNTTDNVSFNSVNVSSYVNTSFLTVAGRVINDTWAYNQTRYFNLTWNYNQTNSAWDFTWLQNQTDTLDTQWLRNQTLNFNLTWNYNQTNSAWDFFWLQNQTDTLDTQWLRNQTNAGWDFTWLQNQTDTLDTQWLRNQTSTINTAWLYNQTLSLNLAQYLSTFNGSYDAKVSSQIMNISDVNYTIKGSIGGGDTFLNIVNTAPTGWSELVLGDINAGIYRAGYSVSSYAGAGSVMYGTLTAYPAAILTNNVVRFIIDTVGNAEFKNDVNISGTLKVGGNTIDTSSQWRNVTADGTEIVFEGDTGANGHNVIVNNTATGAANIIVGNTEGSYIIQGDDGYLKFKEYTGTPVAVLDLQSDGDAVFYNDLDVNGTYIRLNALVPAFYWIDETASAHDYQGYADANHWNLRVDKGNDNSFESAALTVDSNNDLVGIYDASPNTAIDSPGTYSDTVTGTTRTLIINSSGEIGYASSSERYKKNVENNSLLDVEDFYKIEPVKYNRLGSDVVEFGYTAEDVAKVFPQWVTNATRLDTVCSKGSDGGEVCEKVNVDLGYPESFEPKNGLLSLMHSALKDLKDKVFGIDDRLSVMENVQTALNDKITVLESENKAIKDELCLMGREKFCV